MGTSLGIHPNFSTFTKGVPISMNQVILEPRERDFQSRDIQDASGAEVPVLLPSICENKIPLTELSC